MRRIFLTLFTFLSLIPQAHADAAFERVMSKRELRCAYTIYPPFIIKDPNTGKFSGLFHDFLEEMGKQLNIKIVWAEEVGSDAIFQGLGTERYDAVCAGYSATSARANGGSFTKPLVFVPYYTYVRAEEERFKIPADLNKSDFTVATMDGEFSQIYRNAHLPQSKEFSFTGLTQAAERFEAVAGKKADATIAESAVGDAYMSKNPGKIKSLPKPAAVYPSVVILSHDAYALQDYLNAAIDDMNNTGMLERIVSKYQTNEGSFLLPSKNYQ